MGNKHQSLHFLFLTEPIFLTGIEESSSQNDEHCTCSVLDSQNSYKKDGLCKEQTSGFLQKKVSLREH